MPCRRAPIRYAGLDDFTDGGLHGGGVFFMLHALFILELLAFSYALSHSFSSSAFAMALLPALTFGLIILPIFAMLLVAQFDSMVTEKAENRMTMRELIAILMLSWAGTSPHGFFVASTWILILPHEFTNDHTAGYKRGVRMFSEDLSPVWLMVVFSVTKTVACFATAVYLDVKNLMPLPEPAKP